MIAAAIPTNADGTWPRSPECDHRARKRSFRCGRLVSGLKAADPENYGDRPIAKLLDALDHQADAEERIEQLRKGMVTHPESSPNVVAPPRRLLMPAGQAIGRMRQNASIVHPLGVRPVDFIPKLALHPA